MPFFYIFFSDIVSRMKYIVLIIKVNSFSCHFVKSSACISEEPTGNTNSCKLLNKILKS